MTKQDKPKPQYPKTAYVESEEPTHPPHDADETTDIARPTTPLDIAREAMVSLYDGDVYVAKRQLSELVVALARDELAERDQLYARIVMSGVIPRWAVYDKMKLPMAHFSRLSMSTLRELVKLVESAASRRAASRVARRSPKPATPVVDGPGKRFMTSFGEFHVSERDLRDCSRVNADPQKFAEIRSKQIHGAMLGQRRVAGAESARRGG